MLRCAVDQFDLDGNFVQNWPSIRSAAMSLGMQGSNVFRALDCSTRSEGGYRWRTAIEQSILSSVNYECAYEYTDQDRAEFNRRIPTYMPVIYNLIKKLSFVDDSNRDDYIQEALISCWRYYHKYTHSPDDGKRFGGWFKVTSRWGIFQYWEYSRRWKISELSEHHSEIVEEDNSVARAIALYRCIEDLSDVTRKIVMEWLDDKTSDEICDKLKISHTDYYRKFMYAKNLLREKFNVYYYGLQQSKVKLSRNIRETRVDQYDLMGNFVARWPSMESTKEKGFSPTQVSACINLRAKSHAGFVWKLADDRQRQTIIDAKQN